MSGSSSPTSLPGRRLSTPDIMVTVLIALTPAIAIKLWFAGALWALTLLLGCISALILEALALRLRGRNAGFYLQDGSVLVTAFLLALMLPASAPWWLTVTGISIAVLPGKHMFGGLGQNLFNPVVLAYLGLLVVFPGSLELSAETALSGPATLSDLQADMVMTLTLFLGGSYLLLRRVISWHIPATLLFATALLFFVFDMALNSGMIMLVAFFLATDPVTSPGTQRGKLIYGLLIAVIATILSIRLDYLAAAAAAILIMNASVPALDYYIRQDRKHRPKREQKR